MGKLKRLLRYDWPLHFILVLTNWLPDNVLFLKFRGFLIRPFFGKCGPNLRVGRQNNFYNPSKIILGRDIYISYGCVFMADAMIFVDDEVLFGPYCVLTSGNHTKAMGSFRFGNPKEAKVSIGKGTWIGAHSTVTAGSEIGAGSLIAAGAVVVNSFPPHVMLAGVPAREIKQLD